ncbi:echinoderm microtubule-associated protein-like CG42247 isoform X1 [Argiope bruennichi]|uniref:echinoderm microtubule-associated protein-like CG42247 isoform X1 n=1 Tax=Argiope bruennichi TaxID=94029 RepID=UPI0024940632|nr:echinoderm microtubule-associated protein-like CG42247 isoform X1 [Argiope bruennichi]
MLGRRRKLRDTEKARRLTFYRNGDYFDSGVKVALRGSKPFPTMPHLLDYLSLKARMPAKKLFDARNGQPITSLDQFENGGSYVVTSDGKFEALPYGSVPRLQTSHVADALPAKREDLELFRPMEDPVYGKKKRKKKRETHLLAEPSPGRREGRLLTVATREGGAKATLLFNDKNPPPFEDILRDFGHALGLGQVKNMSTPSGRQVRSISQLKNEFQDVDTFFLDETDTDAVVPQLEEKSTYSSKYAEQHSARSRISRVDTTVKSPPLEIEWLHGYDGSPLLVLDYSELVYAVGSAIILYKRSNHQQRRYMDHTEDVCSLLAHPSRKMIASGQVSSEYQEASVHIWLIESLQTVAVVDQLLGNPVSVAFSAHDFVLLTVEIGTEENNLSFWDWEGDALLGRVQLNEEHLVGGEFHPQEADLAVTFGRHHLAFWRRKKDGFLSRTDALAPGHSGRTIQSWAFVGETGLAVGDSSGYITLWALLPGDAFRIIKEVRAHQGKVSCMAVTSEGTLISGGQKQLKAWDAHQRLQHLTEMELADGEVKALQLQGMSGSAIYVGTNDAILEGSLQTSLQNLIPGVESGIYDLCVDFQGQSFVTVDRKRNICRWSTRRMMWRTKPQVDCCCVGFHPEGRAVIAGGANGKLLVLHADGGLAVASVFVADAALKALAYNKDGSVLAVGCEDGNIYICGAKNHGYLYKMHMVLKNEWPILQVDWSGDSESLQSCYRNADFCEVALWKVAESKRVNSGLSKSMDWPQHTCILSHNVLGIWKAVEGAFYLSCHRFGSKLAAAAQDGCIRIFPYPCREAEQVSYEEQRQGPRPVDVIRFLNRSSLVSSSGPAIFIWNIKE